MSKLEKNIVVLGAGISGLASAYWLKKEGYNVTVIEKNDQPGGAMITEQSEGYLVDYGPNSGLETTPLIKQLADEVGIGDEMIYANDIAKNRFILKNNQLYALPMGALPFLKTKLFSAKGKLRLLKEPFIGKSDDGYYQSIAEFVSRRLGQEFLDYAIDPFVSGVFAGDPSKLSVKSAFPKLYRLEELYGGLFKGMFKGAKERKKLKAEGKESKQNAKMFSFVNGMQSYPRAIAKNLNGSVNLSSEIVSVVKENNTYKVTYKQNGEFISINADAVLSTIPSHKASSVFSSIDNELANKMNHIYYPTVLLLYLGFNKSDIKRNLDGFGFLIPSKEKKNFLGAIWSSTIFSNRADDDKASFTLFVGGAKTPKLFEENDEEFVGNRAIQEFKDIMGIEEEPQFIRKKLWDKAIPQYNLGHVEFDNYWDKFEKENPGLFLGGNYRGGISVGDCMKNSEINFNKINEYLIHNS